MNHPQTVRARSQTANLLFSVAIVQLFVGPLYGWFYWKSLGNAYLPEWIFIFSGPIYVVLAFTVRWFNYVSLITGFVLYFFFCVMVHPVPPDSGTWQDGLILKLPILVFLLWGLLNEFKFVKRWYALLMAISLVVCGFGIEYTINRIIGLKQWSKQLQDSLVYFINHVPKEESKRDFVSTFCNMDSKLLFASIVISFILGVCSLSMCVLLSKLAITWKKSLTKKEDDR